MPRAVALRHNSLLAWQRTFARLPRFGSASAVTPGRLSVRRSGTRSAFAMTSPLFLGVDVGTQGTKVLVLEGATGEVLGRGSVGYAVESGSVPGRAEQDPAVWVDALQDAVASALGGLDASAAGRVRAIGVSGQQHGLVAMDAHGHVLRPCKLWCDVESAAEAVELSNLWGFTLVPSFTVTKLLWLKRHEPDIFARLAHVLLPHDYVNWWLTGRYCMEAGDASGTGVFDIVRKKWDAERIQQVDSGLIACFPEIVGPSESVGTLQPEVARLLGLRPDVVVAAGSGDNACSALGAGAVAEGTWCLSLGTSGTLFGPSATPVLDPNGVICPFCDATGQYLPLLCTLNCTGVVEDTRKICNLSHEELTELAAEEEPGCSGLTFLPYLSGERTPNWPHATGTLLGLRAGLLQPGLLYRAAMEGATFTLLAGMRRMEAYGLKANELRVVGGGSKNRLWRRIVADAFQLPLRFPAEPESAALGAALQAAACYEGSPVASYVLRHPPPLEEGVLQPNHALAVPYLEAFNRHQRWGATLFGGGTSEM